MDKDGWRFVGPVGALALIWLGLFSVTGNVNLIGGAVIFAVITGYLVYFFRDPERQPPDGDGWVVSPADGKVLSVSTEADGRLRIAIFLSVFDVHVNRAPVEGTVKTTHYQPGRFFKAYDPRATKENEQVIVTIKSKFGIIELALIAGILARRVVCRLEADQTVALGARIGLIRFGSRAEVVLPPEAEILIKTGDRVQAGATALARFSRGA